MALISTQTLFLLSLTLTIVLIYLLSPILTPFMLGAILAYLASPAVKWLDKRRVPHILSVIGVFCLIFGLLVALILLFVPLLQQQFALVVEEVPGIYRWVQEEVVPWLREVVDVDTVTSTLSAGLPKAAQMFKFMLSSTAGLVDVVVSMVLTPVVTFYLLRDWDGIISRIKKLLPTSIAPTVIKLAQQCNDVLGEFFRGQLMIMFALGLVYGVGLSIIGLKLGFIIGMVGGLLSVVPFLGSIFVVVAASIASVVQFGAWQSVGPVLVVYLIGQCLENYVLTPYLVGNRIGLHPVAVIFAVMAGGTLFGFFGILLALPAAAVIMVIVRYLLKYKK